jgi:hypothetical protein
MPTKLMLSAGAIATADAFAPMPSASAICDQTFFELTGYCSPCHLVQALTHRPQDVICIQ